MTQVNAIRLVCKCGAIGAVEGCQTRHSLIAILELRGWKITIKRALCPKCAKGNVR